MGNIMDQVEKELMRQTDELIRRQKPDGSWRFCFENGIALDAYTIILLRNLEAGGSPLIRRLHDRILAAQEPDGGFKLYSDEEGGNLSAAVEAYYALLYSGYSRETDEPLQRAKSFILSKGGIGRADGILTKAHLAIAGQRKWPKSITAIPLEALLLPSSFPVNLYEFSGYSRVHLIPMLILADKRFSIRNPWTPDVSGLHALSRPPADEAPTRNLTKLLDLIQIGLGRLIGSPASLHEAALGKAEQFILQRIEGDGTLYSYGTSTILMIYALLAQGYDKKHALITRAIEGLTAMLWNEDGAYTIQNSPSTVWDTALLAYALKEAGVEPRHESIRKAQAYLLEQQHHKKGDWAVHNPGIEPGGWGFSETNTLNPDVDDSTAALRALRDSALPSAAVGEACSRGLHWVISMQNRDGGWPAFEKNTDNTLLTWIAIDGAKAAAIDPSEADLTGRTLEYLGSTEGLDMRHEFIRRGVQWLSNKQEKDGSWYGRWGICYIYGTWAALTGLMAVGVPPEEEAVKRAVQWLLRIQNPDGGWGESCQSDKLRHYVPLGDSTPSQTAWALDALIAADPKATAPIHKGVTRLLDLMSDNGPMSIYPTGAGLPGSFYVHYHSYRHIWPLLALAHYRSQYRDGQ